VIFYFLFRTIFNTAKRESKVRNYLKCSPQRGTGSGDSQSLARREFFPRLLEAKETVSQDFTRFHLYILKVRSVLVQIHEKGEHVSENFLKMTVASS
jgi:hypothetical protein